MSRNHLGSDESSRCSDLTISSSNPPPLAPLSTPPFGGSSTPKHENPPLPPGCHYGYLTASQAINLPPDDITSRVNDNGVKSEKDNQGGRRVIWVDFAPNSRENPFYFSKGRKMGILIVAIFFTGVTALATSAYSIGEQSMARDLGLTSAQAASGLALYAWGFGLAPLLLAPLSEEFGRKWTCVIAVFIFWQTHLFLSLGKNLATIAVGSLLRGAAGSVGATLVGGCISDIFIPSERGTPMAAFGAVALGSTGLGPLIFAWVEANPKLEWRWINWILYIIMAAYFPFICLIMRETRATVILRRKAAHLRKTATGFNARFTARSEIEKVKFTVALRESLLRPITFLIVEPVVTFFSLWVGLCWGVFYIQIAGLPYLFQNVFGFSITGVGLVYITMILGALIGFCVNFITEALYRRHKDKRGVEARLYTPMAAGISFTVGCLIFAFTSVPEVHWIGACVGAVIIIMSIMTIYICCFTYLSECYGSYASSAIAAQSFTRNMFGGAFTFLTKPLFDRLTVRWGTFVFACISAVLAIVPFVAFRWGPQIRARSKYSKQLMAEEARRIELDKNGGEDSGDGALEGEHGEGGEVGETLGDRVKSREKGGEGGFTSGGSHAGQTGERSEKGEMGETGEKGRKEIHADQVMRQLEISREDLEKGKNGGISQGV